VRGRYRSGALRSTDSSTAGDVAKVFCDEVGRRSS
jgi:hypothetical protein